jgi:hypothetical protein
LSTNHLRLALAATIAIAAVAGVAALAQGQGSEGGPSLRPPDLVQRAPRGVFVTEAAPGRFQLAFDSRVENQGFGTLEIEASRASTAIPRMRAAQVVFDDAGSPTRIDDVGRLEYVTSPDHSHWHYLDFDRYSLRRLGHGSIGHDQKTGFCLGDRYPIEPGTTTAGRTQPRWDESCGSNRPNLLRVSEGISPGFGDDYPPALEGQSIDITRLSAGDYRLVHHVNPGERLLEADYANNVATAIVRIRRLGGRHDVPTARVLSGCEAARRC